jgi:hypothetical protein
MGERRCQVAGAVPPMLFPMSNPNESGQLRQLTDHKVNGLNEAIAITVLDSPGPGGACHHYQVVLHRQDSGTVVELEFQQGPIKEAGINGISNEALLAVVLDRLRGFQAGQFSCRENALALTNLEQAMMWLQKRTRDRMARGVEGRSLA